MIEPIYTVEEALQAEKARRLGLRNDPQLKKLGKLSTSLDVDIQRIWYQTPSVAEYLNLAGKAIQGDETVEQRLHAIWMELTYQEERTILTTDLTIFFDYPMLDTAELIKIPMMFRKLSDEDDASYTRVPRLFPLENEIAEQRTPQEIRALHLMRKLYENAVCNDPQQSLLEEVEGFLNDFGISPTS